VRFENPDALPLPPERVSVTSVLLLTGSCASGKSTVSWLLAAQHGLVQVDGDWVLAQRRGEWGHTVDYRRIDAELATMAEGFAWLGLGCVIAQVILPDTVPAYAAHFNARGIPWRLVALMPARDALLERSRTRATWPHPTPEEWVHRFQDDLLGLRPGGRISVHDNTEESPEQTADTVWRLVTAGR
jgi:hypothetical protein